MHNRCAIVASFGVHPYLTMSLSLSTSGIFFEPCTWQPEVLRKLESHHLVGWSKDPRTRTRFAASIQSYLMTQPQTEVMVFHGRSIMDLDGFCSQLESQTVADRLTRTIEGPSGIVEALRTRLAVPGARSATHRVMIWHDADVLMRANPAVFDALVEAIVGVSGELEFGPGEGLFIQRAIFLGSEHLRDASKMDGSAFRTWDESQGPFWSTMTGLASPPVSVCAIDVLTDSVA